MKLLGYTIVYITRIILPGFHQSLCVTILYFPKNWRERGFYFKMNTILPTFTANKETLAILPSKQIEFSSIVLQMNKTFHVAQTPMEIIKESCVKYNSTYEGRRKAIISNTYFRRKIPIPICDRNGIYTFPTHATNHIDCCWFFYDNIARFYKHTNTDNKKVIIHFKNEVSKELDISMHIFEKQMARTYLVKERLVYRK